MVSLLKAIPVYAFSSKFTLQKQNNNFKVGEPWKEVQRLLPRSDWARNSRKSGAGFASQFLFDLNFWSIEVVLPTP
jgi:hypothetical protein